MKQNPSRTTVSPVPTEMSRANIGPAKQNVWNSPRSPHGSTPGGSSARSAGVHRDAVRDFIERREERRDLDILPLAKQVQRPRAVLARAPGQEDSIHVSAVRSSARACGHRAYSEYGRANKVMSALRRSRRSRARMSQTARISSSPAGFVAELA